MKTHLPTSCAACNPSPAARSWAPFVLAVAGLALLVFLLVGCPSASVDCSRDDAGKVH